MREADDERFLKYSNDRREGGADPKRFSVNLEWSKQPSVLKEVYQISTIVYHIGIKVCLVSYCMEISMVNVSISTRKSFLSALC